MPESELPPVPEDDDLNATVIEVMTAVEVLLDGSSVIDVFAVNSERQKSWSFNRGLITKYLIWSRKSLLIKRESHACEMGPDMEVEWKRKSTSVYVGLSRSRSDRGAPWQSHVVSCIRSFDHAMGGLAQVSPDLKRHQDSIPEWR